MPLSPSLPKQKQSTHGVTENIKCNALIQKGLVLHQEGKFSQAQDIYLAALKLQPNHFDALQLLGAIHLVKCEYTHAVAMLGKAISINPRYPACYANRGAALRHLKREGEAIADYTKAIDIDPNYAQAYNNRGNLLRQLGEFDAALEDFNKAIKLNANYVEAYSNRAIVLKELMRYHVALDDCNKALSLKSDFSDAYLNRGVIFQLLTHYNKALANYQQAIALKPDYADAYSNLGSLLIEFKDYQAATVNFDKAISLKPDSAIAYAGRGTSLRLQSRHIEALNSIQTALQLDPKLCSALQFYSLIKAYLSDYSQVCRYSDQALSFASKIELASIWENRLYLHIYHPDLTARHIVDEHMKWGAQFASLGQGGFAKHDRTPKRRLKVGYVSPDFRGHTCRFYFEPLFSKHNHTEFELFAYSNVLTEDEHTERLKPYFDHWRSIVSVSDEAAAEMIRHDQIDILVDACGHMMDTRLTVFAHKPAPIQVTWLGAAWTTGLPQMDYVLFDPYMAPEGALASEQIVRLPCTWAAFRPGDKGRQAKVQLLPAAMTGQITFGYSGRTERLNHRVFKVWGNILNRLPQARIVLDLATFADTKTALYYQELLQSHGVDTTRVVMRHSANIFVGLGDIDILLDSFPHSGGTMLFDAVWMGVPVVTLASDRPVGRIGTSLMTNLRLSDWVAKDEQEYEDKAVGFAQDIPALINIRASMRSTMEASPVMDEVSFTKDVENAFKTMWQSWID